MQTYKSIWIIAMATLMLLGCQQENTKITNTNDYETYLELKSNRTLELAEKEKEYWLKKYTANPNQVSYLGPLAAAYSTIFDYTGDIQSLKKAEEYLLEANERFHYTYPSYLQSLSRNYIAQHRFKEALALLEKAEDIGDKLSITEKMLFDVHLELGNDKKAYNYLLATKRLNDFDYLIRLAKWEDHQGNLNNAINYMEKAKNIAEQSKNEALMLWSYTNLADFYGHAGKIKYAYQHYLKALNINPNYNYALKGIAWIVYSHEKNTEEANRIIDHLISKSDAPELYLLKADIAEFKAEFDNKKEYLNQYFSILNDHESSYGEMYNSYSIDLYTANLKTVEQAIVLANREVNNRATPGSYAWLAWAELQVGNNESALAIINQHVVNKTYEPTALYHMAEIYKANGLNKKVGAIKKELMASLFELGPNMRPNIEQL